MKAQKGRFLSGLILIFGLAITFATVFLILDQGFRNSLGHLPGWFSLFLIVFLLARLAALYAIWDLRRWGVYVLLLLECVEVSMGLFVFTDVLTLSLRLLALPLFLVLLLIWFHALRPKWHLFI